MLCEHAVRRTLSTFHLCPEMHAVARITNITTVLKKIPKITIIAKITKITNQASQTGKCNRSQAIAARITILQGRKGKGALQI